MGYRSHRRIGWFGFLLAAFALVSQIALGAVVATGETARSQIAALDAVSAFCHDTHPAGNAPHQRPQRPANPALCPLGVGTDAAVCGSNPRSRAAARAARNPVGWPTGKPGRPRIAARLGPCWIAARPPCPRKLNLFAGRRRSLRARTVAYA